MTVHDEIRLHNGLQVPPALVETIRTWPREDDVMPGWLTTLPASVAEMCTRWGITLDPVVLDSMITLVLRGSSAELGPVIVKSSPLADEFRSEAAAMALAASPNVARLYDVDLGRSIMVMERIVPGTQLREVAMADEEATRLAARTVATMWRPVAQPDGLHPLRRWMRDLFSWEPRPDLIPTDLVRHAQDVASSLLAASSRSCLLHGDFQHHNLLRRANGEWVIIDLKGLLGDPGFEIAAWMYNPPDVTQRDDYRSLAARRIAIWAAETGLDQHDLTAWAFAGSVLSACWSAGGLGAGEDAWLRQTVRGATELQQLMT
jgi:streptomycin 6-kinase